MSWYTSKQLAGLPGLPRTERAIQIRAKRDQWSSRKRQARGGGMEYALESLPPETRAHLAAQAINDERRAGQAVVRHARLKQDMTAMQQQGSAEAGLMQSVTLPGNGKARMDAKTAILAARNSFIQRSGLSASRGHQQFCMRYNDGRIEIDDWVRELIPSVHPATVYRWADRVRTEGAGGLSGYFGKRKGSSKIDTQAPLREFIVGMLRDYPHMSNALLYRAMTTRFKERDIDLPGVRAVERWSERWKRENHDAYLASTNPDAWKSQRMFAFGDAGAHVARLNQEWQLDGTPADILLEDGRYALTAVVDVYSRRAKILVTRTAISAANAQLLRNAIIDWGMPESAKTDNGADYISRHMTRVLTGLNIEQHKSAPFNPQQKPFVERFFGTFSRDILELMPGFIGHNVAERKAIDDRKAFSDRLFKKDQMIEIRMTAAQLQEFCDEWCDMYHHRAHSGLGGKTPNQMVQEWPEKVRRIQNERALDLLLQPVAGGSGDGYRTIGKKGIKIGGIYYIAPELAAWSIEHPDDKVLCLQDPDDFGRIMVYGDGAFICIARSDYEGLERKEVARRAKKAQQQAVTERKRELKRIAKKVDTKGVAEQMVRERAEGSNVALFPGGSVHSTPALEAAAAAELARIGEIPDSQEQQERRRQARADAIRMASETNEPSLIEMNEVQRWRYWKSLKRRMGQGETVSEKEGRFFEDFQKTDTWRSFHRTEQDLGQRTAQ